MAKVFIEESTLTSIGNAIRNKKGTTSLIDPANFATEIASIQTGGGEDAYKTVFAEALSKTITSVVVPEGTTKLGQYAFTYCTSLTSVILNQDLTEIGSSAFANCTALPSIEIPGSVKKLGGSVFSNCNNLTSVVLNEGLTSISSSFINCPVLTNLTIPSTVTTIGGNGLVMGTDASTVTITMKGTTPPKIQANTFNTTKLNKIRIPSAALNAYSSATNWSSLTSYFETY